MLDLTGVGEPQHNREHTPSQPRLQVIALGRCRPSASRASVFFFFFFFGSHRAACRILVPRPGIEPVPPAVEARSPNHWTARVFLQAGHIKGQTPQATANHTPTRPQGLGQQGVYLVAHRSHRLRQNLSVNDLGGLPQGLSRNSFLHGSLQAK